MGDPIAHDLRRQADAAMGLVAALRQDGHDDETIQDTTEGETSLFEAVARAIEAMDECDVIVAGCKSVCATYEARASKFAARAIRIRTLIEQAMLIADIPTVKIASATVTVKSVPAKPTVQDESLVPSRYFKTPAPVLNKTAINEAIAGGETIPGVAMDNGGVSLQIRRK